MVSLRVNGEAREFETPPTLRELLRALDAPAEAIAVEVNRVIVPRRSHDTRVLADGDEIEVVTFVGGG